MWVNIDFSLDIADIINYLKELDYQGPIYLSFNTLKKASQVLLHLPSILNAFAENDLPVLEGPHFVDEGCIIDGELKTFDELYAGFKKIIE